MKYRHEVKQEISRFDMIILTQRLSAILKPDSHAKEGAYKIRSLYFDNLEDKALMEKINGNFLREKFRIRMYNDDESFIRLERKFKRGNLGYKTYAPLTKEQTLMLIKGEYEFLKDSKNELLKDFYEKIKHQGLRPMVLVDYERKPFVFKAGNVRVTLDYNIRTALKSTDFFSKDYPTVSVPDNKAILEVKWDEFLPDIVKDAISLEGRNQGAFSKYAASRMYE